MKRSICCFNKYLCVIGWLLPGLLSAAPQSFNSGPEQVQLIELYTSEGCSSCPPADKRLSALKNEPGLWTKRVPVAFHVDYWDYIGWQDPFASPDHSLRQRQHAADGNFATVYTPAFLVDGQEWRGFFRGARWPAAENNKPGSLGMQYENGKVDIRFDPSDTHHGPLNLHVAWLGVGLQTSVTRGENRGRKLKHDFVILKHQQQLLSSAGDLSYVGDFSSQGIEGAPNYALVAWLSDLDGRPVQAVGGFAEP